MLYGKYSATMAGALLSRVMHRGQWSVNFVRAPRGVFQNLAMNWGPRLLIAFIEEDHGGGIPHEIEVWLWVHSRWRKNMELNIPSLKSNPQLLEWHHDKEP